MYRIMDEVKDMIQLAQAEIELAEKKGMVRRVAFLRNELMALYKMEAQVHQVYHWHRLVQEVEE